MLEPGILVWYSKYEIVSVLRSRAGLEIVGLSVLEYCVSTFSTENRF